MKKIIIHQNQQYNTDLSINGIGIREQMPPGLVNRPLGTNDRLLMFFYDQTILNISEQQLFQPNTMMLWHDKAAHLYGNNDIEWLHSWIHFHGYSAERYIEESGIISGQPFTLQNSILFETYLKRLYDEIILHKHPDTTILKNQFNVMLREIARATGNSSEIYIPQRILKIKQLLERFPEKRYMLKELAAIIAISIPRLCAEFKQHIGRSPIDYQISCRMERAAYLLSDRNLNINDIAERSGYPDIYQFSKAFKKYFGKSPARYRQEH